MPRGLGEDPLKRQKKATKRAVAQSTPMANFGGRSGGEQSPRSDPQDGTMVDASSSRPASYNDVFFRKRSESAVVASSADADPAMAQPAISASAVAQQVLLEPPAVDFVMPGPLEAPPALDLPSAEPSSLSEAAPIPDSAETPKEAADTAVVVPEAEAAGSAQPEQTKALPAAPVPQEGGLLKRIFGRFRK